MRTGLSISILDKASPELRRFAAQIQNPDALLLPVARQAANLLKKHFRGLETTRPNQLGGERQHWYARVAESVNNPVVLDSTAASVAITQPGLALRVYGGVVRAKTGKGLAIPVAAESYGIWARDWRRRHPDMPLFKIRGARGMYLAAKVGDTRSKAAIRKRGARSNVGDRRFKILYVLRTSVKIPADPSLLPPAEQFRSSLQQYAAQRLETLKRSLP
jgi:hypothetical protein